ncbi:MAG: N-acetylmuramoyl-L-alanine amidase [Desulfobulbaceae bacterium]|nr:N-acetylmuramoyl-L-alanine amidase [Desulfobulbaceae bacterium]
MAIHSSTDSVHLKNAILRGVYDENLRIENERHEPRPVRRQPRAGKSKFFPYIMLVILAGTLSLAGFFSGQGRDSHNAAAVAANNQAEQLPLPIVEIEVPVPVQVPLNSLAVPTSYILRPPEASPVEPLNEEKLLDYSLILNNDQVRLSSVFGLGVQTIVIDPGHGGRDPGAIGALNTQEKDIVLDIAKRLQNKLQQGGNYRVLLTRENDTNMTLAERVEFANAGSTDLFISLHVNALPQKSFNVTETYYYGPPTDPETLRLAEQENRGSGVLTKDFENMIKKIGNTFKEQESANLAAAIQYSLFTNVKKYDKNIADAGIKIAPFVVLLGVDAPAVLVEISCITKKEEELKLNMPAYREEITSFLAQGTIRYLERRYLHVLKGEDNGQEVRRKSS